MLREVEVGVHGAEASSRPHGPSVDISGPFSVPPCLLLSSEDREASSNHPAVLIERTVWSQDMSSIFLKLPLRSSCIAVETITW